MEKVKQTAGIYFSSDHHFWHRNIQKFQPTTRRGESVAHMNELMIEAHNAKVQRGDTMYFLGDFSFGNAQDTENILKRLNGNKHLIYGNHDKILKANSLLLEYFQSVQTYKTINVDGVSVVMFHFPMRTWDKMHYGSYHLFGHVHSGLDHDINGRSMDVGVDTRPDADMAPWSWEEVHRILGGREVLKHHERDMT